MSLSSFIANHQKLLVLTGAGCSTGSGIPDYRDQAGQWKRAQPMTYQAFTGEEAARRRYWARSLVGWPVLAKAKPNGAHTSLTDLESAGKVSLLITQNVDGLHQKSGATNVLDLHGRIDSVVCLSCQQPTPRGQFQSEMTALNPQWQHRHGEMAPDGDADLDETDFSDFKIPACAHCAGVMKPDVVFFGESVPKERATRAMTAIGAIRCFTNCW